MFATNYSYIWICMTLDVSKNPNPVKTIDTRGTVFPGQIVGTKKAMDAIEPGGILGILSADERTRSEIPLWCREQGHEFLGTEEHSGYFVLYIQKRCFN
jgi:tRNA 2-thiouridine synthesizing protein A